MTPYKLKSGTWCVYVYDHTEISPDGKKKNVRKCVTGPTRKEVLRLAAEWSAQKTGDYVPITVGDALDRYIEARKDVISPSTFDSYTALRRNAFGGIEYKPVDKMTQEAVQRWVDAYSLDHSPKSCRNAHGLLVSAIAMVRPSAVYRTQLPQAVPASFHTPSTEEITALLSQIRDTSLERAVLLAAFGTLRAGEVCALTNEDVDFEACTVSVSKALAKVRGGGYAVKPPKNLTSVRVITYPREVIERLRGVEGRLVDVRPNSLPRMLRSAQRRAGVPVCRFHDLRAYSASIMHALGVPDVYIMQRGGWKTDATLKAVYRRAIGSEGDRFTQAVNSYFSEQLGHM